MFESIKKRLFPFVIALSALSVAGSAAFYSVFGLSKLFAGAATQVIIMAGSLEFAKLVVASLLYQYWGTINKILKGYLMIACFVLMVITSGGIYGFLSGAYQTTATQSELLDKSLVILQHKQERFNETKEDLILEKTQLNQSISDLRVSLSNPHQVSWYDKNSETVITSSSSSARRALQAELKTTITERDNINLKLDAILDSITTTDIALLNKEISNEEQRELGPLKYLATITGWEMDKVVNWFLLLIIFVFDPLAIALVVAANMAFARLRPPKEEDYFEIRNKHLEKVIETPVTESIQEPSNELKKRVKENQEKLKVKEINEKEMDEKYFNDLKDYIEFSKEEPEIMTYPKFVEKHYTKPQTEINTYGDDDWAKPTEEEEITVEGGEIEVTIEPTKEQLTELEQKDNNVEKDLYLESKNDIDLQKIENYLNKKEYVSQPEKKYNLKNEEELVEELEDDIDTDRLTDTTKTIIVEKDKIDKKERVLRYDKTKSNRKKI